MPSNTPLLKPVFESIPCPWTPENPRHDHQLIFPLDDKRLMLVWCEYYAASPSVVERLGPEEHGGQQHDQMPCRLSARISRDAGRTWGHRFIVQDNLWKLNVKHPNLIRAGSGELLFFCTGWNDFNRDRRIYMKRSPDDGETWTAPKPISGTGFHCLNNDHILRLSSGRVLLTFHHSDDFGFEPERYESIESWVYYSDDDFATHHQSRNSMALDGSAVHEPAIAELADGSLLALLRTSKGCQYRSLSRDEGETWSPPEPTVLPSPEAPCMLKRIPDSDDLLIIWNNAASSKIRPRNPLTAAISKDSGQTWVSYHDIVDNEGCDSAYAAATFNGDEVLVTYYHLRKGWSRDTEVVLKIFTIDQFYDG